MSRYLFLACCLLCSAGPVAAQTTFPVDAQSAYLHIDTADLANNALAIDLASMGLVPGCTIAIVIPPGATHLFVSPADIYYRDNSDPDGDLGVKITLVSTTSAPPGSPTPRAICSRRTPTRSAFRRRLSSSSRTRRPCDSPSTTSRGVWCARWSKAPFQGATTS